MSVLSTEAMNHRNASTSISPVDVCVCDAGGRIFHRGTACSTVERTSIARVATVWTTKRELVGSLHHFPRFEPFVVPASDRPPAKESAGDHTYCHVTLVPPVVVCLSLPAHIHCRVLSLYLTASNEWQRGERVHRKAQG